MILIKLYYFLSFLLIIQSHYIFPSIFLPHHLIQMMIIFSISVTNLINHLFFLIKMNIFPHNHEYLYFFLKFTVSYYLFVELRFVTHGFKPIIAITTNFFHLIFDFLIVLVSQFSILKNLLCYYFVIEFLKVAY